MDRWPQKTERPSEEIVREMREMAAGAPKATDQEFEASKGEHSQFANNLFTLFLALKPNEPKLGSYRKLLDRAEAFGDSWKRFLQDNQRLLAEINSALEEERLYSRLLSKSIELMKNGEQNLSERVTEELQVERIGVAAWNRLSPLLEKAAAKMREYDIDPAQFSGES